MATKKEGILFPWKHGAGAQPSYVEELDGESWSDQSLITLNP
jgi:hypothetical protein